MRQTVTVALARMQQRYCNNSSDLLPATVSRNSNLRRGVAAAVWESCKEPHQPARYDLHIHHYLVYCLSLKIAPVIMSAFKM